MKHAPPLILRLAMALMAIVGAAGVGYLLIHADKYLFNSGRWLGLGGVTIVATVAIGLGFRWREFAAYLVLTGASLMVGLYGAETILRFIGSAPPVIDLGTASVEKVVAMIRTAEAADRRLRPKVGLAPAFFSRDADGHFRSRLRVREKEAIKLGGFSNTPTLFYDQVALDWTEVTADRYGHFNDDAIWDQGAIDVLVVGASHTQSGGARFGHDFVSLLKRPDRLIARLALGGIAGLSKLGMLREFGPLLQPRTVFWLYADRNDLEAELERELNTILLARYLEAGFRQDLPALEVELDQALDVLVMDRLARHERRLKAGQQPRANPGIDWRGLIKLGRLRGRLGIAVGTPVDSAQISGWAKIMARAKHDVAAWGGHLVFVYLPMWTTVRTGNDDPFKLQVLKVMRDLDVPIIDISDDLLASDDPVDLFHTKDGKNGGHFNEEGHRRLAQRLEKFLSDEAAAGALPVPRD